jgi:predicted nucleotidyltransferase
MNALPPLALSANELAVVKAILVKHVPEATIWVFGSCANGKSSLY